MQSKKLKSKLILLDRIEVNRFIFGELCKVNNFDFFYTNSFNKALKLVEKNHPDIIIIDNSYVYRGDIGQEYFEKIKQLNPGIKIIGFSAYENKLKESEFYGGYIVKPSSIQVICEVLGFSVNSTLENKGGV